MKRFPPLAIIIATLLGLGLYHAAQGQIERWSTTPASNNGASPYGFAEGAPASQTNDVARATMSEIRRLAEQSVSSQFGVAGGTADAILITPAITWPSSGYISGQVIRFRTTGPNTVAAPTIKVSGMTTTATIAKISNTSLSAGDMPSGAIAELTYDGSVNGFILTNANELTTVSSVPLATTGVSGQVLATNGTVASYVSASVLDIAPRGFIGGYRITPAAVSSINAITVSPGHVTDDKGILSIILSNALTKYITGTWVTGSNQGGLDTGSVENNQTYHVLAIKNQVTGVKDILFTKTITNVTMPAGFGFKRRIASFLTNGSAQVTPFSQMGDLFTLNTPVQDAAATNPGTSAVTRKLTVPTGIQVYADIVVQNQEQTNNVYHLITSFDQAAATPSSSLFDLEGIHGGVTTDVGRAISRLIRTNTSGQIRTQAAGTTTNTILWITTHGWRDDRGAND